MSLTTARDIIKESLEMIGIGAEGETLSAETQNSGLNSLNLMLSMWGGRNLLTTAEIRESFTLTASQASYLMGVNSVALPTDFNTTKPSRIISAFLRDTSGNDYPIKLISREEYNDIAVKAIDGIPEVLAQDPGATQQANQVMTVYLYPAPYVSTYTLFLFSEKPLTWISALEDTITMEYAYIAAIVSNLARILSQKYGRVLHPETIKMANDSLSVIETINSSQKRPVADVGLPIPESSNIMTGR